MLATFLLLIGLAVGSFLNVVIDRLPRGKSLISPPSHCDACQRTLGPVDLVPVLSYLWLRGQCRTCSAPISRRVPVVEALTGLLFGFIGYSYGLSLQGLFYVLVIALLVVVTFIDLEHGLILDVITYPAVVLALVFAGVLPAPGFLNAVLGGLVGLGIFFVIYGAAWVFYRSAGGGMGLGDVKLALLVGLILGFPAVLVGTLLSFLLGSVVAVVLLVSKKKGQRDAIPYGPYLAAATLVTLFWGEHLLDWYLGLFRL